MEQPLRNGRTKYIPVQHVFSDKNKEVKDTYLPSNRLTNLPPVYLTIYPFTKPPTNLPTYYCSTYLPTYWPIYLQYLPSYLSTHLPTLPPAIDWPKYLPTYLPFDLPADFPTYLLICLPTYLPTYLPTNRTTDRPIRLPTAYLPSVINSLYCLYFLAIRLFFRHWTPSKTSISGFSLVSLNCWCLNFLQILGGPK